MTATTPSKCDVCGLDPTTPSGRQPARIVTESSAMRVLLKRVARFATSDAPVAILGETGTGKEVVARLLHANSSRAGQPFVAVNVAALPADLLESELFGHRKGAFTGAESARRGLFEEARGGSLFLDEIGEMPLSLQVKLLRTLQDGEVRRVGENRPIIVDLRIVCATHRELRDLVQRGLFREDLYFRLRVLELSVPPLRERTADILPLANQFLHQERAPLRFSPEVQARLLAHSWPGNVRELQNVVRHGAALATGPEVGVLDLPDELGTELRASLLAPRAPAQELRPLADVEREHVLRVLELCGGSQSEAATVLGIARNTLWRKLRAYSAS